MLGLVVESVIYIS